MNNTGALYDLGKLNEISKGNQMFIDKMIQLFIDQAPKSVEEICAAYQNGELDRVKSVAHRIKPSIDNMGITSLKEEIREIESLAGTGEPSGKLTDLIEQLKQTIHDVVVQLKENQ